MIRSHEPLSWTDVKADYYAVLKAVKSDAEVLIVKDEHLLDWQEKLFGQRPLHADLDEATYWAQLKDSLPELSDVIPDEKPEHSPDHLHARPPSLHPNQRAVV